MENNRPALTANKIQAVCVPGTLISGYTTCDGIIHSVGEVMMKVVACDEFNLTLHIPEYETSTGGSYGGETMHVSIGSISSIRIPDKQDS